MLGIIGNNERALSLAIVAKRQGLDVTIFGQYKTTPSLPKEMLRQSINWDLVSFLPRPDYDSWRMDYFLGQNRNYNSQSDHEASPFIRKEQWQCYVKDCIERLRQMNVIFREEEVISFTYNHALLCNRERVMYDQLCIAEEPSRKVEPLYIKPDDYSKLSSMIWTHDRKLKLLVLPTGNEEYSLKAATYLRSNGHHVTYLWDEYKDLKFSDYSVPSFKEWGQRSSLGSFYREFLKDRASRYSYWKKLEAFHSIKRETLNEFRRSGCNLLKYNSLNSLNAIKRVIELEEFDYFIDLRANEIDVALLKPNDCVLADKDKANLALVTEGMRIPKGAVYITGRLAEFFDGPRQRFISSSGTTSMEIIKDIKERYV